MRRTVLETVLLGLIAAVLAVYAVETRGRPGRPVPKMTRDPAASSHIGWPIVRGGPSEVLAAVDIECRDCAPFYVAFERLARSTRGGARFAVLPYHALSDSAAAVKLMAVACAHIESRDTAALRALLVEHSSLQQLRRFAAGIGLRNAPDFESCVQERRLQGVLDGFATVADTLQATRPVVVVNGQADLFVQMRREFQALASVRR